MNEHKSLEPHGTKEMLHMLDVYEIRLKGTLDLRWSERFDGLSLTHADDGITVLRGPVVDQAALHGVLRTVRDLGVPLLSVVQIDHSQAITSEENIQ